MPRGRPRKNVETTVEEFGYDSAADEEYEVEAVESHQIKGKGKNATLEYLVKWKNYPSSDNTWEPASAVENAHQLVDEYWNTHGGEEQREEVLKQLQGGNKAPAKEKKSAAAEEEKKKKSESKKKRASSTTEDTASTSAPKKKRARPSTPEANNAKGAKSKTTVYESEDEFDVSDSEVKDENFRINKSWANVLKVHYVKRDEQDDELYAIIRWKDNELSKHKTSVVAKKAPLVLIDYYESRLSFEREDL